jgi:hypothetical protein
MAKRICLDAGGEDDAHGDRGVRAACAESLSMILALKHRDPTGNQWGKPRRTPWRDGLGGDSVVRPGGELVELPSMASVS